MNPAFLIVLNVFLWALWPANPPQTTPLSHHGVHQLLAGRTLLHKGAIGPIDPSWQKYDPPPTNFTNADGTVCGAGGDDHDKTTYLHKNRSDKAEDYNDSYHHVEIADVRALPDFPNEHTRYFDGFKEQGDKDQVLRYEGIPLEVEAYMVDNLRDERGEATNCGSSAPADVDWHLVIAEQGQTDADSVFAEITPRVRATHPNWQKADFRKGAHLRIDGWLMYDPDHRNQMTEQKRATLWEVHPIMKVWKQQADGSWLDLDQEH